MPMLKAALYAMGQILLLPIQLWQAPRKTRFTSDAKDATRNRERVPRSARIVIRSRLRSRGQRPEVREQGTGFFSPQRWVIRDKQ